MRCSGPLIERVVKGEPQALLLVEFAEDEQAENLRRVAQLGEVMGDLGFGWDRETRKWGGVVEVADRPTQAALAEFRAAGLNVMMSMRDERKPVSFIEDCAVPLEHLADYTERLNEVFARNGTKGTFYAHASEGCLHVRPVLNLKLDLDLKRMRAIAEEAFALVREYKGSHSGEHGDGIVRSEFHEMMFGSRLVRAFDEVKTLFDPDDALNPHRIVDPPKSSTIAISCASDRIIGARISSRCSTGRPGRAAPRVSRARRRCATTTAPAANRRAASCAHPIARRATSAMSRAGAPTRCGSLCRASSGRTR